MCKAVIRCKNRYSYTLHDGLLRVDLTKVSMTDADQRERTTLRIEVELLRPTVDRLEPYFRELTKLWCRVHQTVEPYTSADLAIVVGLVGKLPGYESPSRLNSGVLMQARNIKPDDWRMGGVVGNPASGYVVTPKAHGHRKLLVIAENGVWLTMPPFDFNRLTVSGRDPVPYAGTVLDGESLPQEKEDNVFLFLAFDVLRVQEKDEIYRRPYVQRHQICKMIERRLEHVQSLRFFAKPFESMPTVPALFKAVNHLLDDEEAERLPYPTDGIMFIPADVPYNGGQQALKVLKWKPTDELTVDFSVRRRAHGVCLFCSQKGSGELVEWTGIPAIRFDVDGMLDKEHPMLADLPTGMVVEFSWDYEKGWLTPVRRRDDKAVPNDIAVAKLVWRDIFNPMPASAIRGKQVRWYLINMVRREITQAVQAWCQLEGRPTVHILMVSWLVTELQLTLADLAESVRLHVFTEAQPTFFGEILYQVTIGVKPTFGYHERILYVFQPWPIHIHTKSFVVIGLDTTLARAMATRTFEDVKVRAGSLMIQDKFVLPGQDFEVTTSKLLLDTYTLNYELLMPDAARELLGLVRVAWYGLAAQPAAKPIEGKEASSSSVPLRRHWFAIASKSTVLELPMPWSRDVQQCLKEATMTVKQTTASFSSIPGAEPAVLCVEVAEEAGDVSGGGCTAFK